MSAPPSSAPTPNGQNPAPKRPPPPFRRRPRPVDPLVPRKKPIVRPQSAKGTTSSIQNGGGPSGSPSRPGNSHAMTDDQKMDMWYNRRRQNGGWWDPILPGVKEFPVVTTKRALKEGLRHHIMRFATTKGESIDPTDQNEFARPVSLHRRDPRQPPPGRVVKADAPTPPPIDDKEAERLAQLKAEKEAQRAIDLAQIAPVAKEPPKKVEKKEKNWIQSYYPRRTDEQKKEAEVRYEEALPWHLEDADGKNVWVGSYTAALSEANVAFIIQGNSFRMVPLEKYYRFTAKPPFHVFSIDEAEALMNKKVDVGRWAMRDKEREAVKKELADTRRYLNGPSRIKLESNTYRDAPRSEKVDQDDMDMSGDEFQDDDENPTLEIDNDEETKEAKEKLRRDHLGANLFGDADEKEVEKEDEQKELEEFTRKLFGKELRKALAKREHAFEYKSDSDDSNPFESSSSEDEDDEKDKDKDKEDDQKDGDKSKAVGRDKAASGTNSKGTNTPSGRKEKKDAAKKAKSLKRPGSPNLSESSGNESSRKKVKKNPASVQPSRSGTPLPILARGKGGATSDGEETSDGGRGKKIKLVGTGTRGTPVGSRAGSPAPATGSNTVSPTKAGPSALRAGSPSGPVEPAEIIAALAANPEGITVGTLLKQYHNRVGDGPGLMPRRDWIKLVKDNAKFGPDRKLRPKT